MSDLQSPIPDPQSSAPRPGSPELLAPAGDWAALEAALEAGAGAVYFGLTTLNARRRARNFRQEQLAPAVDAVHAHGARAYLTLNIDLSERELGQAARILELARQCHVDAVLVRDPALLALRPEYPELEFHFSTQTCMANRADVEAAGRLGASRVVLARELTLSEIAAASQVHGVQTEVFVQGALCFSVSGRCLLSSWVGGRSGNRGACTSPCRVPWTIAGRPVGTLFSMRDLATVHRLDELREAGVTGLKIEGRLKSAAWVRQAVQLYRQAMASSSCGAGVSPAPQCSTHTPCAVVSDTPAAQAPCPPPATECDDLLRQAVELGAYTGRAMTCGYLDAQRDQLTGEAGRTPADPSQSSFDENGTEPPADAPGSSDSSPDPSEPESDAATFDFSIMVEPRGIVCRCERAGQVAEWTLPKTVVHRRHKAVPIGHLLDILAAGPLQGCELREAATNDPEFLLVPRALNALVDRVGATLRQMAKPPGEAVRIALRPAVQAILRGKGDRHPENRRSLGDPPDRVRLAAASLAAFLQGHAMPETLIVEGLSADSLPRAVAAAQSVPLVVALPQVFFDGDTAGLRKLLRQCKAERLTVEVNSWGGLRLAQQAGVRMESGPGLPVLNSLAARVLCQAGVRAVTLSIEADRRQLEEATAHCASPCSLVVFGRPPLLVTRARLPDASLGQLLEDRRGTRLVGAIEQGLTVFRPADPFDLRDVANDRIRVRHLVVDLVGSDDPLGDWQCPPQSDCESPSPFRFNYDRSLA